MVQGELLTAHTGGVHGYGWSPGGGSSFRQGAGAASPGSPDLETAAAAIQRGIHEKEINIRGFHPTAKYRRRGAPGGPTSPPGGLLARPRVGPRVRPGMRYCFRSGRFRPNPRTKHISVPPRHMTKSNIPDFNMISQHYRYKDTT